MPSDSFPYGKVIYFLRKYDISLRDVIYAFGM